MSDRNGIEVVKKPHPPKCLNASGHALPSPEIEFVTAVETVAAKLIKSLLTPLVLA